MMEEQAGVGRVKGLSGEGKWPQAQGPSWHDRKHHQGFTPGSPGIGRTVGDMCHLQHHQHGGEGSSFGRPQIPFFFPKFLLLQPFPKVSKPKYGPTGWVPPGTPLNSQERGPAWDSAGP